MSANGNSSPNEIIAAYTQALKSAKGAKAAASTQIQYVNGWFVVTHANGKNVRYRKREILFSMEALIDGAFEDRTQESASLTNQSKIASQKESATKRRFDLGLLLRRFTAIGVASVFAIGMCWLGYNSGLWQLEKETAAKEKADSQNAAMFGNPATLKDTPPPKSKSFDSEHTETSGYNSVLGNLWIGTALYDKSTHVQFGFVVAIDSDGVWVADKYSVGGNKLSLDARKYDRSYITDNFVTK